MAQSFRHKNLFERLASSKKSRPKQHCKQDITCRHHFQCQICLKIQKQYLVKYATLQKKYLQALAEIQFLTKLNKQFNRKIVQLQKQLKLLGSVQQFKQTYKQELQQKINQQRAAQDAITQIKIQQLNQQIQNKDQQIKQLQQQRDSFAQKLYNLEEQLSKIKMQNIDMEYEYKRAKEMNQQMQEKLYELSCKVKSYQNYVQQKNSTIERIKISMDDVQRRFMNEKASSHLKGAQCQVLSKNLKNKQKQVSDLTKCTIQNKILLQNLKSDNLELRDLVGIIDSELHVGRLHEDYLRQKLISAQQKAVLSEGFAHYNLQKVELMKNDLQRLKYTL